MRVYSCLFLGLLLIVGGCRKKVDLFGAEAERIRLQEEAEDLFAMGGEQISADNELLYLELQGQSSRTRVNARGDSLFIVVKRPDYLAATDRLRINDLLVSEGAKASPDMGDQVDVSKPFPIVVTAANGHKRKYIVSVSFTKEGGNEILQFVLQGQDKRRNPTQFRGDSIVVFFDQLPANSHHALNLNLDILKVSPDATVSLGQGQVANYCNPVSYEVTSESGRKRSYTVYVFVRFQLPNHQFEQWYSTNFISGRAHSGYYYNLGYSAQKRQGWASFNDGYYAITGLGYAGKRVLAFPLDRFRQGGNTYLSLTTQEYQNTATLGQDLPFGVSPGVLFTGKLQDYDERGGVSSRNYKRGTMKLQAIDIGLGCAKAPRPKSFAFKYQYSPGKGKLKSYNQTCETYWNFWTASYAQNPDCNADYSRSQARDSMEVSVMLLDKANNLIGLGAFRSGGNASRNTGGNGYLTTARVKFHYQGDNNLNSAERELLNRRQNQSSSTANWANASEPIAKVQVLITASHGLWSGPGKTPVGAVGSKLLLDDLIMEY